MMTAFSVQPAQVDVAPGGCRCDAGGASLTWVFVVVLALFRRRRA